MAEKPSQEFLQDEINHPEDPKQTNNSSLLADAEVTQSSSEEEAFVEKQSEDVSPQNKPETGERSSRPRSLSSKSVDIVAKEITCPRVNCPEKIVFCLDLSSEMASVIFRSRSGDKFAPIKLVKRALGIFLHTKHQIDKRHQFSLVVLQENALWVKHFSSDPRALIAFLDELNETFQCEAFNLTSLFDEVQSHITLPHVEDPTVVPPPYIIRMILIYGRSYCIPELKDRESYKLLRSSPYFFLDVFYVHEPPTDDNKCEEVFDALCDLDEHGLSYIVEVSKNLTKLYDHMIQLVAHPLQRPLQKDCHYKLKAKES